MVQVVGVGVEVDCVEVVYASWWCPWGPECSSYCLRLLPQTMHRKFIADYSLDDEPCRPFARLCRHNGNRWMA